MHGPKPRDYSQRTPKKMKAAALRSALSDRARNGRIHVITEFVTTGTPSTKAALAALRHLTDRDKVLVVTTREDELTVRSLRNLPQTRLLPADQLNTYEQRAAQSRDRYLQRRAATRIFAGGICESVRHEGQA